MAHPALGIVCPTCTVGVGEECITVKFDQPATRPPHGKRVDEAREAGLGKYADRTEKRVASAPTTGAYLSPDYQGPFLCDYVMWTDAEMGTSGHTGRVLFIEGEKAESIGVRPTPGLGIDIPWDGHHENDTIISASQVEGWWPQEEPTRSMKTLRKVNRAWPPWTGKA